MKKSKNAGEENCNTAKETEREEAEVGPLLCSLNRTQKILLLYSKM